MNFFSKNVKFLREKSQKKQSEMPSIIGFSRTTWNNYENGISKPNLDDFIKIANYFGISETELLHSDISKGQDYNFQNLLKKGKDDGKDKGGYSAVLGESEPKYEVKFQPKVITVDNTGNENILYVPAQARAGYLRGYGDAKYLEKLQSFSMPGLRNGTFRMFDVTGPSMAPTVGDNDKVIGRFVESLNEITDDRVYIVVTKDGIVLKRVLNRVSQRGKVVLKSDTIAHRTEFKTYEIDPQDILEIWYAYIKISADFSAPMEIYQRVNDLESDMIEQRAITASLLDEMSFLQKKLK